MGVKSPAQLVRDTWERFARRSVTLIGGELVKLFRFVTVLGYFLVGYAEGLFTGRDLLEACLESYQNDATPVSVVERVSITTDHGLCIRRRHRATKELLVERLYFRFPEKRVGDPPEIAVTMTCPTLLTEGEHAEAVGLLLRGLTRAL